MEKRWFWGKVSLGTLVDFLNKLDDVGVAPTEIKIIPKQGTSSMMVYYYFEREVEV